MKYVAIISLLVACYCAHGQIGVAVSGSADLSINLRSTKIPGLDYTNNLRGWFPLDDGSGSVARNIMGTGNGALSNSPTWVTTGHIRPTALKFSSPNLQSVLLPSAIGVHGLAAATKMVWVNITSSTTSNRNITYESTASVGLNASRMSMWQTPPTNYLVTYRDNDSGSGINTTAPAGNHTNTWHHFTIVVDSASDRISIYTNGILAITNLVAIGAMTAGAASDPLRLGYYATISPSSFDGQMQDYRVYSNALTGGQIWQVFTKGNEPHF